MGTAEADCGISMCVSGSTIDCNAWKETPPQWVRDATLRIASHKAIFVSLFNLFKLHSAKIWLQTFPVSSRTLFKPSSAPATLTPLINRVSLSTSFFSCLPRNSLDSWDAIIFSMSKTSPTSIAMGNNVSPQFFRTWKWNWVATRNPMHFVQHWQSPLPKLTWQNLGISLFVCNLLTMLCKEYSSVSLVDLSVTLVYTTQLSVRSSISDK